MTDWLTQWLRDLLLLLLLLLLSCWIDVIWHSWTSKLFAGFSAAAAAAAVRRTSNYRRQAQTLIIWNYLQQRLWQLVRKKGGKKGKKMKEWKRGMTLLTNFCKILLTSDFFCCTTTINSSWRSNRLFVSDNSNNANKEHIKSLGDSRHGS